MKLRIKLVMIVGLFFIMLSACSYLFSSTTRLFYATILVTAILMISFLYALIVKRIESLAKQTEDFDCHDSITKKLTVKGSDEITYIAEKINQLLSTFKEIHANDEQHVQLLMDEINKGTSQGINTRSQGAHASEGPRTVIFSEAEQFDHTINLPNRVFFNQILNKAIGRAHRHKKILAVLLINIDQFTKLSVELSPEKCNGLLKEMGKCLNDNLRKEDVLAKLDEDEFIILLDDMSKTKFAGTVAEKILRACQEPILFDGKKYNIKISIGISIYPTDGLSLEDLMSNAESALTKAQQKGGATYQFYTQELDVEAREYIQLESALRKAIHNNELTLLYQPKLDIKSGRIAGVESLLRWNHPVLGIVNPSQFIPIAEETGLIMEIGEWALREACKINKHWQDEGYEHLIISLNISSKQFLHPGLTKSIATILEESQLNSKYLELELTEKTIMDNIDNANTILNGLKELGVQLSIDHFGTGVTSISALKQLPINTIKIDRSFIKGVPNNPNDVAIVNAFIGLAHNLGMLIVAEGVETAEQVQYLTIQQCNIIQGYYLSHPVSASKITLQIKKLSERVIV